MGDPTGQKGVPVDQARGSNWQNGGYNGPNGDSNGPNSGFNWPNGGFYGLNGGSYWQTGALMGQLKVTTGQLKATMGQLKATISINHYATGKQQMICFVNTAVTVRFLSKIIIAINKANSHKLLAMKGFHLSPLFESILIIESSQIYQICPSLGVSIFFNQ